jgi:hypothetical protein
MTKAAEENVPEGQFLLAEQKLNTDKCLIYRGGTPIPAVLKQDRIYNKTKKKN